MTPALSILLACALGAEARVETGIRAEGSARWTDPVADPADAHSIDLAAAPHLLLRLQDGMATAELAYRPRFTARDVGPDHRLEQLHDGALHLRLETDATWRVEAFVGGTVGRTDLVTLNRSATDVSQTTAVRTTGAVDIQGFRSGLSLRLEPARRDEILLSAGYTVGGGATRRARALLPIERAATASAEYGRRVTRLDRLSLRLSGTASRLPDQHSDAAWATAIAGWRRHLTAALEGWAGAGAVGFYSSVPDAGQPGTLDVRRAARPAGELGLAYTGGPERLSGGLEARLGAISDRYTGVVSQGAEGAATLSWPATATFEAHARGTGAAAWTPAGQVRRNGLEVGASYSFTPRVRLDVGAYGAWQRSTDPGLPTFKEYALLVGVGVDAPPLSW
jgi:hypothetical protein